MADDNGGPAKVLIVDDNTALLKVLSKRLENEDFTVFSSEAAAGAIAVADEQQPEVVLLDWKLPDMEGPQAVSLLRDVCQARIIMITGKDAVGDCVTALDAGCDDYMRKPLQNRELLLRIKRLL